MKIQRRIHELELIDIPEAVMGRTGEVEVARSNIRETIREVFGPNSPEFQEHSHIDIWAGGLYLGMTQHEVVSATNAGRAQVIGILKGLIGRLEEKGGDLTAGTGIAPSTYFDRLNIHLRLLEVTKDLFHDGHHWEAVFAASKALVNYIKDRSGCHELDGAPLVRKVFSRNDPILSFNDLSNQTELDEQEGMMHLFEGAELNSES